MITTGEGPAVAVAWEKMPLRLRKRECRFDQPWNRTSVCLVEGQHKGPVAAHRDVTAAAV